MKYMGLAVVIETKSGNVYQVALTEEQKDMVANLLQQMHGETIKVFRNKLSLELETGVSGDG